ncbi:AMP-binding protein [Neptuniibacter sp. QD37_6]|uniref:AMP-binding protein n=1 Tax=Neptuniibacter sp. QD37_6 TaxID=3398210 RepID=UPI0039F5CE83
MLEMLLEKHYGNGSTLGDEHHRYSYEMFNGLIQSKRDELYSFGLREHQLVLYKAENTLDTLILSCSIMELGAVAVPFNPSFSDSELNELKDLNQYAYFIDQHGVAALHEEHEEGVVDPSIVNGIFTSGSTGTPKLVCHRLSNHIASANASAIINPCDSSDHWHVSLPIYHIGGFSVLFRAIVSGASLTIGGRVEDPLFIQEMGITHASMVATQLQRFKSSVNDASVLRLKTLLIGGGPTAEALLRSCADLPLRKTYGMSEISSQACTEGDNGAMAVLDSVELKIDKDGEILLAGESLFSGYLVGNQLKSPESFFNTGDIGRWENNRLLITGRKDNQFISGGENIQPEMIEKQLLKLEGVTQAVVVPVACPEFGCRPFAWVNPNCSITQIKSDLKNLLPRFMIPVGFAEIPDFMLVKGLKLSRKKLTALAEQERQSVSVT